MRTLSIRWSFVAPMVLLIGCRAPDAASRVDDARLVSADKDSANWLTYGRTYDEQRFSPLRQVSESTVTRLGLAWSQELPTTRGLEATPIVVDGVLYTTGSWSIVYAFDAATGKPRWTYDPKVDRTRTRTVCCDVVNRGLALYKGRVYVGTLDGRLIAIDAQTGKPAWDVVTVDQTKPYAITGAPRIAKGRVLIGNAGGEFGIRGYVSAYDAQSGALAWRVYTVPGDPAKGYESKAMEVAAKTWKGDGYWKSGGGGPTWDSIVYDPDLDLVLFGTGNGTAWYRELRSPGGGDNLYLASIIAVRAETGEQVWHYQATPGDNWDYDANQPLLLADLTIAGTPRKVVMQANKNGFFYVLDRKTGQFISGTPFVDGITWAKAIDSTTGRPIETPEGFAGTNAIFTSPDPEGAHNWNPIAFDASKGLVFMAARSNSTFLYAPDPKWESDVSTWNLGDNVRYEGPLAAKQGKAPLPRGELVAWNPVTRRAAWRVTHPVSQSGGVLATAGNLVFQGRADGMLAAYRSTDGTKLWEFNAGTGIIAPPVTFLAGGKQYVTLMAGWGGTQALVNLPTMGPVKPGFGRILTFVLDGSAKLNAPSFGHTAPPTPAVKLATTPAEVREGGFLYARHCMLCHGFMAVAGTIPDLRYSTAEVHAQLDSIVRGGSRKTLGMPSFGDKIDAKQLRAIQAYVLWRAGAGH
jgi:quinohemoprotein ethanol dehydrogenase